MRGLRQEQWSRIERDYVVLKEDKVFAISGKQKGSAREETSVVSGTTVMSVQNRHQKPLHPLSHQHKEVEVRREKRTSEAGVHLGSSIDSRAKTSWKVFARNHLVTIGILPNGGKCSLTHRQVEGQPSKRLKKGGAKGAVAIVKSVRQMVCVSQDAEPPESVTISRKGTKVLGSIRRVPFTRATQRYANIRENKGPLGKIQVKVPHQRSPYALKFEDRSQEEIGRQERCAHGDAWRLA